MGALLLGQHPLLNDLTRRRIELVDVATIVVATMIFALLQSCDGRKTDPSSALAYLPRGRLVRFERAGHFPEIEEPEEFARLMRSFAT